MATHEKARRVGAGLDVADRVRVHTAQGQYKAHPCPCQPENGPQNALKWPQSGHKVRHAQVGKNRAVQKRWWPLCTALTRHETACTIERARAKSRARVWQPDYRKAGANHRRVFSGGFFVPAVSNAAACAWEPARVAGVPFGPVCHPRASRLQPSVWQRMGGGSLRTTERKQTMHTQSCRAGAPIPDDRPRLSVRKSHGQWLVILTTSNGKTVLPFDSFEALLQALRLWWALHAPPDVSPPSCGVTVGRGAPCLN